MVLLLYLFLSGKKNSVIIQHLTGACLKLLQKSFHCQAFLFLFMDIQHNVSGIHHQNTISQIKG